MPAYIVKTGRDLDEYVLWDDRVERPTMIGTRADFLAAGEDGLRRPVNEPIMRRVDRMGSSALWPNEADPFLGWDCSGTIFAQRGYVARDVIGALAHRLAVGGDVTDLLTPLDEHDEVRPGPIEPAWSTW